MKLKRYITNISMAAALCGMAIATGGCHKESITVPDEFDIIEPSLSSTDAPITVSGRALILGGDAVSAPLKARFTNTDATAENAAVIVVAGTALDENSDALVAAYTRGALIVVDAPDGPSLERWCGSVGVTYGASVDANMKPAAGTVFAFNRNGRFYLQDTPPSSGGNGGNGGEVDIPDDDVPLNSFSRWVNRTLTLRTSSDARSTNIARRFIPQEVTHTFNVAINAGDLQREGWSAPAGIRRSTTVDVTLTVYPVHVFDGPTPGDIYFVDAATTIYNSDIFNGIWQRRRGEDVSRLCGFYMSRLMTGALLEAQHTYLAGGPVPGSAAAGQDYTTGIEWHQNCLMAGGVDNGKAPMFATQANWEWNKKTTDFYPGVDISLLGNAALMADIYSGAATGGHQHSYDIANLLDMNTLEIAEQATSDLTFRSEWAWFVPDSEIEAAKTGDDEPVFVADIAVLPFYQTYINTVGHTDVLTLPAGTMGHGAVSHTRVRLVPPPRKP